MTVTGLDSPIALNEKAITRVVFDSETPKDSNARATDYGLGVKVYGKILFDTLGGMDDPTIGLAKWSQVPSYNGDCYRNVEINVVSASQVVRNFVIPQAFVVEYNESLDVETGVGEFCIHIRQKKDENEKVAIHGGFGV